MAQADFGANLVSGTGEPADPGGINLVSGLGALVSLALIAGLGVWGYQLAVRDVTGIPVVRAIDGPMRIQPENPGGDAAAHQGYSVNGVQAEGAAADPAHSLALAPRAVELQPEDQPATPNTQLAAPSADAPAETEAGAAQSVEALVADAVANAGAGLLEDSQQALSALAEGTAPLEAALEAVEDTAAGAQAAVEAAVAQAVATPDIIPASVPGVSVSPRPGQRPGDFAQTVAAVQAQPDASTPPEGTGEAVTASAPAIREIETDEVPIGTRLVQLGAYESADVAREEWNKLALRFEEYLEGKTRVVQKATSGGKTFYRLRAMGFDDLSDARRFCSVLMQGQAACIPVVTR